MPNNSYNPSNSAIGDGHNGGLMLFHTEYIPLDERPRIDGLKAIVERRRLVVARMINSKFTGQSGKILPINVPVMEGNKLKAGYDTFFAMVTNEDRSKFNYEK